jgi:hypothetical protein
MSSLLSSTPQSIRVNTYGVFQCILAGGTASVQIRAAGASGFTTVKTFSADELVEILCPAGEVQVVLTGSAEVSVNWGDGR